MKPIKLFLITASILTLLTGCGEDNVGRSVAIKSETVASVNGVNISNAELDALLTSSNAKQRPPREIAIEELVSMELLRQQAVADKIYADTEVAVKLNQAATKVLAATLLQNLFKDNPVSDEEIQSEYDEFLKTLTNKEYKVRHILSRSQAEAVNNIDDLSKGAKFADIAKKRSVDATSSNGGDLGWASPASFVQAFSDAMVKLEKGEYTKEPVQSPYGWHVIKVEDLRESTPPALEQVKQQMANMASNKRISNYIQSLREKATVEIKEEKVDVELPPVPEV